MHNFYLKKAVSRLILLSSLLFAVLQAGAQCSSLDVKVRKTIKNWNNSADSTIYINKDSSCLPYTLKLKVSGYDTSYRVKYTVDGNSVTLKSDTFNKLLFTDGYYSIKIELIDNNGNTVCTLTKDSMVRTGVAIQPNIYISKKLGCYGAPDTVTLIDSTPNILSRTWYVDGVSKGTGKTVTHVFNSTGYKKVEVFLLSYDSCQRYVKMDSVIRILTPVSVDFSAGSTTGCKAHSTGYSANFNLNGQTITSYNWTFSGGNPSSSTSLNPGTIVYSNAGAQNTSLQVTTNLGCTYTATKNNYINVGDTFDLNITFDDTSLCLNQIAHFKNQTTGLPSSGSSVWSIAGTKFNTNTVIKDSFNVSYATLGTKNIKYEFTYNGCKSTSNFTINVYGPLAGFKVPKSSNCGAPYALKLQNTCTTGYTPSVSYHWVISDTTNVFYKTGATTGTKQVQFTGFNGGRVDTTKLGQIIYNTDTPTVTFPKFGTYSIKLIAVGSNGCIDSFTRGNSFSIADPYASMRVSDSTQTKSAKFVCACDKVLFKSKSAFSDDTIRHWYSIYKFPDTLNAIYTDTSNIPGQIPDTLNYRFCGANNDSFLIRLIDYTDGGCRDTVFDTVKISQPVADFTMDVDTICVTGNNCISFTQLTTPSLATIKHNWWYKHKDSTGANAWNFIGTTANPNQCFTVPGKYSIAYAAYRKGGNCYDSIVKTNCITVNDVQFDFKSASATGCKNSTIKFDTTGVKLIGSTPSTVTYSWSVSPSTNVTIAAPSSGSTNITFGDNGLYDVSLTITDPNGCTNNVTKTGMISIGVVAAFSINSTGCRNVCYQPSNASSFTANAFTWTVSPSTKGGKPVVIDTATANGYSPASPCLSFPDSGTYRIVMRATAGSCSENDTEYITIDRSNPDFTATQKLFQCAPQSVEFINTSSSNVVSLYWDFGNGTTKYTSAQIDTLKEIYRTNDSCFDVTLVGTNSNNCTDTMTKKCFIQFQGPVPRFKMLNTIGCEPLTVTFQDKGYNIVNKTFDYGDGSTTTGNLGTHTYNTPGNQLYEVFKPTLAGYDGTGCYAFYPNPQSGDTIDSIVVYKKAICYFTVDTVEECEPYAFQFTDTGKYATIWRWNFGDGSPIDTTQNPTHVYLPGTYTVKLWVTNGSGCTDSMTKTNLIVVRPRAKPAFSINDSVGCQNLNAAFTDASTSTTTRLWDFGDGGTSSSTSPSHNYTPGTYTVKLVCNNQYGCKDSITKDTLVHVYYNAIPKIYGSYLQGCEPFSTSLYGDSSTYTDTWTWGVFQGATLITTSTSTNPTFSLPPGTYHVGLVANNLNNCPDSVTKPNYLTVYNRAIPSYTLVDSFGCDTLITSFTNTSQYANYYRWHFQRSQYDTSNATNPTVGFGPNYYTISLYANNANGCADSISNATQIHVANKARPHVYAPVTVGCEDFCPRIYGDSSQFSTSWDWDFENDGTYDATSLNPLHCFPPGTYSIMLRTNNTWNCPDSVLMTNYITTHPKPVADFQVDDVKPCFQQAVNFTDLSTSNVALTNWYWVYGDSLIDSVQFPSAHVYQYPGLKTVALAVFNANGCGDTLIVPNYIYMRDSLPPAASKIQYVTVTANNDIDVFWEANTDSTFYENKLYHSDGTPFINIFSSNLATDVTYTDVYPSSVDPTTKPYSYMITTGDSCGWVSQPDTIHRSMWLTAATLAPMTNVLNWSPYIGWGSNLKEYQVYKGARDKFDPNPPNYSYYRTLPATDTTMTDSLLCDSNYSYYVAAIHLQNAAWVSTSNQASNTAPFISPDTAVSLRSVSVAGDKYPFLQWNPSNHPAIKSYIISRLDNITGVWNVNYDRRPPSVLSFTDVNNVDVHKQHYTYRLGIEDYCGNYSPVSTDIGRTILLDASINQDLVNLDWSPYVYWANGVREYMLEIQYGPNDWRPVGTVPGTDTHYVDHNVYEDLYTKYCYRVVAVENDVLPDTSYSNTDCAVVPSRIWVPNAFTPNNKGDTANEIFKPVGISIFTNQIDNEVNDYVFLVFNKWGERVFETHSLSEGWNGAFKGKPCPDDLYIWTVRARGRDGYPYDMSGTVLLYR